MAIDLNYRNKGNGDLFDTKALKYATDIGNGVKNTQIRKFYDYVLDYQNKSKALSNEAFKMEILPFIKMLNSKVAYASTRNSGGAKLVNDAFVSMMKDCILAVSEKEDLNNFKLFFEAVIGFHKGIEEHTKKDNKGNR